MRKKTPCFLITFHTTAEAMATEKLCRTGNLPGRLIPVPRALSADCGIAWCATAEAGPALREAVAAAGIETEGWYELLL